MKRQRRLFHIVVRILLVLMLFTGWMLPNETKAVRAQSIHKAETLFPNIPSVEPQINQPAEGASVVTDTAASDQAPDYNSLASAEMWPARRAVFEAPQSGPEIVLDGHWETLTTPVLSDTVVAIAGPPDGNLYIAVQFNGIRVYERGVDGQFIWRTIQASPGALASNNVNDLAVLGDELWIGTGNAGISIYNVKEKTWRQANVGNGALPSNSVRHITAVTDAVPTIGMGLPYVWVATAGGASSYAFTPSGYVWFTHTTAQGLPTNDVVDIAVQRTGDTALTWAVTPSGIATYDGAGWTKVNDTGECQMHAASRVVTDRNNHVWFIAQQNTPTAAAASVASPASVNELLAIGVCQYTPGRLFGNWTIYSTTVPGLPSKSPTDMAVDPAGRVWITFFPDNFGPGGVAAHDQGNWLLLKAPVEQFQNANLLTVDAVGDRVWFAPIGDARITAHAPNWLRFGAETFSPVQPVGALLMEANTLWAGAGNVLLRRDLTGWATISIPGNQSAVTALARDGDAVLWIGAADNGVWAYDGSTFTQHSTVDGLPSNNIRDLLTDHLGRLWVATAEGLALRAPGYWLTFRTDNSALHSNDLSALTLDAQDRLWIGAAQGGISRYDLETSGEPAWSHITTAEELPANSITALASAPNGDVWIGTTAGAAQVMASDGSWTIYTEASRALPNNSVTNIAITANGQVWVGTTNGLAHYAARDWIRYFLPGSTLTGAQVESLAADDEFVWAGGREGIAVRGVLTGPIGNAPPTISGFTPQQGAGGTLLTITGTNFDTRDPGFNTVLFAKANYAPCCSTQVQGQVLSVSATELQILVPPTAGTGKITVESHGLQAQSADEFVVGPAITHLGDPCRGYGDVLEIHGSNFGGGGGVYVRIGNGEERKADNWSNTVIRQTILPGDTSGAVSVRLANAVNSSATSQQSVTIATVEVDSIEIQQQIQGVPLIYGKPTLVQVWLRANSSCTAHVDRGRYEILGSSGNAYGAWSSQNGIPVLPGAPLKTFNTAVNLQINFVDQSDFSLLPYSKFQGVRIQLYNGGIQIASFDLPASQFAFVDTQSRQRILNVAVMPSGYPDAKFLQFWKRIGGSMYAVRRMFPQQEASNYGTDNWIQDASIVIGWKKTTLNLDDDKDYNKIREKVDDIRDKYVDWGINVGRAVGIIAQELYKENTDLGKSTHCNNLGFDIIEDCDRRSVLAFDKDITVKVGANNVVFRTLGKTYMHEILHSLGMVPKDSPSYISDNGRHSKYNEGKWGNPTDCNPQHTYRQALVDQLGFNPKLFTRDWGQGFQPLFAIDCGPELQPKSVMSYAPNRANPNAYMETYDLTYLLIKLCLGILGSGKCPGYNEPFVQAAANQRLQAMETAQAQLPDAEQALRLSGSIAPTGTTTIRLSYLMERPDELSLPSPGAPYMLNMLAGDGRVLYAHPFDVATFDAHNNPLLTYSFSLRVPFPDDAQRVELVHSVEKRILWTRELSPNPPTISVVAPSSGTFAWDQPISVSWTADDPDGDDLQFGIDYSADNGQTWTIIEPNTTGTTYEWLPRLVPASTTARLRITASDGFHMAENVSAPFTLQPRPPAAWILGPEADAEYVEGQVITLVGSSLTGSGFDGGSFSWHQGQTLLGEGSTIDQQLDSPGTHTFRLTVNADGQSATESVTIRVLADYDRDGLPDSFEQQYGLNPLDPDDAVTDPDADALDSLTERQLGTHPLVADTDADGDDDGAEIAMGFDPLDPDKTPPQGPVLNVGADYIGFTVGEGALTLEPAAIWISNVGKGELTWSATENVSWLSVSPPQGGVPEQIQVVADPTGLPIGDYHGKIIVTAEGADSNPHQIEVILRILSHSDAQEGIYLPIIIR